MSGGGPTIGPHPDILIQSVKLWRILAAYIKPPVAREVMLVEDRSVGTQESVLLIVMTNPDNLKDGSVSITYALARRV